MATGDQRLPSAVAPMVFASDLAGRFIRLGVLAASSWSILKSPLTIRGRSRIERHMGHAISVDHLYALLSTPPSFLRRRAVRHDQRASPVGTAVTRGPGRSGSIPAIVAAGEFIVTAAGRHGARSTVIHGPFHPPSTPQPAGSHGGRGCLAQLCLDRLQPCESTSHNRNSKIAMSGFSTAEDLMRAPTPRQ